ncbi:MAG: DNA alkylation repair protein [Chitinophagales bacterium]
MKPTEKAKALREVEDALQLRKVPPDPNAYFDLQKYIGTKFCMSGMPMPELRKLFRQGYSFRDASAKDQFLLWEYIFKQSDWHDAMTQSIFYVDKYAPKEDPEYIFAKLKTWVKRVDNWAHSDQLTHHYALLHEKIPAAVYAQLQTWNTSKNPWERRQSVLSLLDYARHRTIYPSFNKIIALVKPLLPDDAYFVQKGVGWCLRECGIVYPEKTLVFLHTHAKKLSGTAFATATEKITSSDKEALKAIRKKK